MNSTEMHKIVASNIQGSTLVLTEPVPEERHGVTSTTSRSSQKPTIETNERKLTFSELQDSLMQLEQYLSKSIREMEAEQLQIGVCY